MSSAAKLGARSQSVASLASMSSMQYIAHGHGYMARKKKPEKPYGIKFTSRMNRTHRGHGGKFLWYAFACFWASLVWFSAGAVFLGHRNVHRVILYRTEVFGPLLVVGGILCVALMGHFCYRARLESNIWRSHIYFKPEGLYTAVAVHEIYCPDDGKVLATGTYSNKAVKTITVNPSKKKRRKKSPYSRSESQQSLTSPKMYTGASSSGYDGPGVDPTDSQPDMASYDVESGGYYQPPGSRKTSVDDLMEDNYPPPPLDTYSTPSGGCYVRQQPIRGGMYRASMQASPTHSPTHISPPLESEL